MNVIKTVNLTKRYGTLVATGQGTHRWRSGSERVEGMPVAQMKDA